MAFKMKGSPYKNYANPQEYKVFNWGNKPTPIKQKEKGKDVEGNPPDLQYPDILKTQHGPTSESTKADVRKRILEIEDRIEFIIEDVNNDRVDREKGFKRVRQLEKKVDELRKTL